MEARTLHDFSATAPNELSFTKGSVLKVRAGEERRRGREGGEGGRRRRRRRRRRDRDVQASRPGAVCVGCVCVCVGKGVRVKGRDVCAFSLSLVLFLGHCSGRRRMRRRRNDEPLVCRHKRERREKREEREEREEREQSFFSLLRPSFWNSGGQRLYLSLSFVSSLLSASLVRCSV